MSEATFEAATVEEALEAASSEIGTAVSDLDYEVVEKKEDFWGVGEGTVVIKAWRRQSESASGGAAASGEAEPVEAEPSDGAERETRPEDAAADEATPAPEAVAHVAGEGEAEAPPVGEGVEETAPVEEQAGAPATATAAESAPERTRREPAAPATAERELVEPKAISGMLEQIFHDMEFECSVTIEPDEGGFLATIDGDDKDALLEGNGRCLSALELLVNNAFRHRLPRGSKVRVDAGDFRNRRDEELSDLAYQVAHSAKQSGRTQETQPLNPYERRLVHLALAEDPAVTTRSRGSGFLKNVQVIPRGPGGHRSRGRRR